MFAAQVKQAEHEAHAAAQQQATQEVEEDLSLFEIQRRCNIKRNQQRMASMGLVAKPLPLTGLCDASLLFCSCNSSTATMVHCCCEMRKDCKQCNVLQVGLCSCSMRYHTAVCAAAYSSLPLRVSVHLECCSALQQQETLSQGCTKVCSQSILHHLLLACWYERTNAGRLATHSCIHGG